MLKASSMAVLVVTTSAVGIASITVRCYKLLAKTAPVLTTEDIISAAAVSVFSICFCVCVSRSSHLN